MEERTSLEAALARVHDERTFIEFLNALSQDWEDEHAKEAIQPNSSYGIGGGWEHSTIGSFLEAASACGMAHVKNSTPASRNNNPWHRAAEILFCGKFYE